MRRILLINPNSSATTTDRMVGIAQAAAADRCSVAGATASRAPQMIVEPGALAAAADEVVEVAASHDGSFDGFIIAAFGDPGLAGVRACCRTPAVGLAEAAITEAAQGGRRFAVATTTPALQAAIDQHVTSSGFAGQYTGVRTTTADPVELVKERTLLRDALAEVVDRCIHDDGAQAVIIGGGPLGEAARDLQPMFSVPIVAPVPAAVRLLLGRMS